MDEQQRAAFRRFVLDNHPDRGGDPDVFVAGLARFRALDDPASVDAVAENPCWDDPRWDDPRWDAPVEIVHPLPAPVRVAVALIRTLRWHRRRRVL